MKIDAYRIVKTLGEGSYGKALLARDKRTNKQYVIKQIDLSKVAQKTETGGDRGREGGRQTERRGRGEGELCE